MKAMVLAAGLGTRLGELSRRVPKCLVEVGGKTMLEHVVLRLKEAGVTEIVINLHHLSTQVEELVRAKNGFGLTMHFSREAELLGTGGGIKNARDYLENEEHFLVYNADIYAQLDLKALLAAHRRNAALATLAVRPCATADYLVCNQDGFVTGWVNEKSGRSELTEAGIPSAQVTFIGVHVASRAVFRWFEAESAPFSIFTPYLKAVRAGEHLATFGIADAEWVDVGTPERLAALRQRLANHT